MPFPFAPKEHPGGEPLRPGDCSLSSANSCPLLCCPLTILARIRSHHGHCQTECLECHRSCPSPGFPLRAFLPPRFVSVTGGRGCPWAGGLSRRWSSLDAYRARAASSAGVARGRVPRVLGTDPLTQGVPAQLTLLPARRETDPPPRPSGPFLGDRPQKSRCGRCWGATASRKGSG